MTQGIERVRERLREQGAAGEVRMLPDSARTAATAAAGLGVEVGQIANSLIFEADGEPVLVIASGGHRVDTERVAGHLGVTAVRRADPPFVRDATGFTIGGVPPVGHDKPLRTVVDDDLVRYDTIWAAAGHPHAVFPTTHGELLRMTGGTPADVGCP
ncbi:MAG: YbaK/EbsC family protein [Streptosporangiales bacterium]